MEKKVGRPATGSKIQNPMFGIKLDPELLTWIKGQAEADGISASGFVRQIILREKRAKERNEI